MVHESHCDFCMIQQMLHESHHHRLWNTAVAAHKPSSQLGSYRCRYKKVTAVNYELVASLHANLLTYSAKLTAMPTWFASLSTVPPLLHKPLPSRPCACGTDIATWKSLLRLDHFRLRLSNTICMRLIKPARDPAQHLLCPLRLSDGRELLH